MYSPALAAAVAVLVTPMSALRVTVVLAGSLLLAGVPSGGGLAAEGGGVADAGHRRAGLDLGPDLDDRLGAGGQRADGQAAGPGAVGGQRRVAAGTGAVLGALQLG